jgi:hypothetical protein
MSSYTKTDYTPFGPLLHKELAEEAVFTADGANTYPAGLILGRISLATVDDAQLWTLTPTAANDTQYQLDIQFDDGVSFPFQVKSDASGTATEIVTLFKAQMAANAAFTARAVATGTATLLLTNQGVVQFTSNDAGPGAWASLIETTPGTEIAATGKWLVFDPAAVDGSQEPRAMLFAELITSGSGDTEISILVKGEARTEEVTRWDAGTPAALTAPERDQLRANGIFLTPSTQLGKFDNT